MLISGGGNRCGVARNLFRITSQASLSSLKSTSHGLLCCEGQPCLYHMTRSPPQLIGQRWTPDSTVGALDQSYLVAPCGVYWHLRFMRVDWAHLFPTPCSVNVVL